MRVLVTGWFSFVHGEVTAGDALALDTVASALARAGMPYDEAWSPVFRPDAMSLEEADPARYTHLVFVCGPVHGEQVRDLHERFPDCHRVAVGVSVIDPADPAVTGFHRVLARDGLGEPDRDLAGLPVGAPPVAGVVLAQGQGEYGARRRHDDVAARLTGWLGERDCAALPLDTRLDRRDWRLCSTADQFVAVVRRLDVVVTTRLHGLVLALRAGVPPLAVDPVDGGGKVSAQAGVWEWPVLPADADVTEFDAAWAWCLSEEGRRAARDRATAPPAALGRLIEALSASHAPGPA
ncbi:polysaccharide pyruvyl transferase family protein [Actinoallomurus spadix]|uniref:Polysaccharide pyruvyl transferase family protein n=1 Tax=Actinoallomurus spadix TaxID=79912 RepID=A0ABN0XHI6_9ACTN|nr:polysaccharide pyruvyl transferase family protein [Actinoallomurus spadix]MCO5987639.1 polysaccharide pyruvyl transferase family protein [Actinoallomurus spadix]